MCLPLSDTTFSSEMANNVLVYVLIKSNGSVLACDQGRMLENDPGSVLANDLRPVLVNDLRPVLASHIIGCFDAGSSSIAVISPLSSTLREHILGSHEQLFLLAFVS